MKKIITGDCIKGMQKIKELPKPRTKGLDDWI
jgi:hypothetical protein